MHSSRTLVAAVLATTLASAGCTIAARHNRGLGFIADGLAVTGALVSISGYARNSVDGYDTWPPWSGAAGNRAIYGGAAITALGALAGLAALEVFGKWHPEPRSAEVAPAHLARPSRSPVPRSSDAELQHLADLANAAAAVEDCRSAQILTERIGARDAAYRDAVVAAGAVAPCVR